MIEVAIASMQEALAANGEQAPAGSLGRPDADRCRWRADEDSQRAGVGARHADLDEPRRSARRRSSGALARSRRNGRDRRSRPIRTSSASLAASMRSSRRSSTTIGGCEAFATQLARPARGSSPIPSCATGARRDRCGRVRAGRGGSIEALRVQLLPRDPNDDRNVIMEIRAGAGGEEAALFARELFRMYLRYAERHRWKTELMTANETGIGGMREVIFEVDADRARTAGSSTRAASIASSACPRPSRAAASTPRPRPSRCCPKPTRSRSRSTRTRTCASRSSARPGPGGQSVNTTDSAVRITHLPTGLVVEIQDEKSQHKNKAKAMSVLRARLLERSSTRRTRLRRDVRRCMVGSGDRSEKIRTYNFPQDRVTDHRIDVDLHNLPKVLDGDLDRLLDELITTDQAERLAHFEAADAA